MRSADGSRDDFGFAAPPETADHGQRRYWAERLRSTERPADSLAALQERAAQLPPGHPSSPWDERGRLRPPAPNPADLELPEHT